MAVRLAADGFDLALAGRRPEPLAATVAAAQAARDGARAIAVATDVGDPAAVSALFAEVEEQLGRVDLLFNNAGRGAPPIPMEDLTYEQWQAVVDVNLTGSFLSAQAAIRMMKRQSPSGGRIINNGSISAHAPRPSSAPYTATKHAVTGLTRSIALDGRGFGISAGRSTSATRPRTSRRGWRRASPRPTGPSRVEPTFDVEDVARAVSYMAGLPPSANVLFMTVMATEMPFVGRG